MVIDTSALLAILLDETERRGTHSADTARVVIPRD